MFSQRRLAVALATPGYAPGTRRPQTSAKPAEIALSTI